jgi:hypothetical protein
MLRAFGTLGVYSMVTLGKLTSYKENECNFDPVRKCPTKLKKTLIKIFHPILRLLEFVGAL